MSTLEIRRTIQRRTVAILAIATILGGLGIGASFSAGALLIADITGNPAISGLASTLSTAGAAAAGIPLARLAMRKGRRIALATGNLIALCGAIIVILAAALPAASLLFVGLMLLGVGSAVQLQSRFAAADLATAKTRSRDLSLVVWSITIGAVTGPNLLAPGAWLGERVGIPELSGVFVFAAVAQLLAGLVVWIMLRPDPLLTAQAAVVATGVDTGATVLPTAALRREASIRQFAVIIAIAMAHATMVGLMAMTPLHLRDHGASVTFIGFTISLHIAGMYALSPLAGLLAGKIGARPVMVLGFVILGISAVGTATAGENATLIQVALTLVGLGWCAVTVAGASLLTELTPNAIRPKRQGQSDTIMNIAGAAFGAVSGLFFSAGGFPLLSIIAGALMVVGVMATIRSGSAVGKASNHRAPVE
ncbi:MFS transporter [Leucobacter sp. cx-42]|uniref:MFS transporter n=1 Tax=unclassified Leucobacter TaxID=2621730 RepID=UPI00165DE4D6|nr:MFS transporter [Leucobacter sp. cx-42]